VLLREPELTRAVIVRAATELEEGDPVIHVRHHRSYVRPKAGHEQQIQDLLDQWNRDRKPKVKGTRGGYVLRPDRDPREVVLMAVFENRDTYRANADDPEQDKWFRQLREHLEADPTWEDGEITTME
jgi:heme-degrading monooxygenase HmoA